MNELTISSKSLSEKTYEKVLVSPTESRASSTCGSIRLLGKRPHIQEKEEDSLTLEISNNGASEYAG